MTGGKYNMRPGGRISSMEREGTAEAEKLSLVPPEDAAQIGAEYWKNQCDYWQRKALEEKETAYAELYKKYVAIEAEYQKIYAKTQKIQA